MTIQRGRIVVLGCVGWALLTGCAAGKLDLSQISRPARAAELSAFDNLVGSWTWEAELLNAEEPDRKWSGTAEWKWELGERWLGGRLSAKCSRAEFGAGGAWGWNAREGRYEFFMVSDWGYSQEGSARYDAGTRTWTMDYEGTGLDGTRSDGRYVLRVVDNDTLDWRMEEWTDGLRLAKKLEMTGTYKRKR